MPSRYEGYGLALTEAMQLGLPVVCSRVDSLPELCELYRGESFLFHLREDSPDWDENDSLEMAACVLSASECEKGEGQIIMSTNEMTDSYLEIYNGLSRKH